VAAYCLCHRQGLICAGIVQYGVPAVIVEAVPHTGSSCHSGGTLCTCVQPIIIIIIVYATDFVKNVKHYKTATHQARYQVQNVPSWFSASDPAGGA